MKKVLSLLLVATAASAQMRSIPQPLITAPSPDPRVGLKGGLQDAGEAIWNMRLISHVQARLRRSRESTPILRCAKPQGCVPFSQ